jgi:hypothetical protein
MGTDDDIPGSVLDLAELMPECFSGCFRFLIIALQDNDDERLRDMGIQEKDVSSMLSWLKEHHPIQVQEAMSIKSQIIDSSNSPAAKEHIKDTLKRMNLRSIEDILKDKPGADSVESSQ